MCEQGAGVRSPTELGRRPRSTPSLSLSFPICSRGLNAGFPDVLGRIPGCEREEAASGELFRAVLQGRFLNAADQSDQHLKAEGFTPCCPWINGKTKAREHFHRR